MNNQNNICTIQLHDPHQDLSMCSVVSPLQFIIITNKLNNNPLFHLDFRVATIEGRLIQNNSKIGKR